MSRFCPLFSSSSGNCIYIGDTDSGILVDAGKSCKSICNALSERGIDTSSIKAVAVTHEHSDHRCGLRPLLKKLGVPVIASKETISALQSEGYIPPNHPTIEIKDTYIMGGIEIKRLATSHDCDGSSAFVFSLSDGNRVAVCTDLGFISEEIENGLLGCSLVMIESNHDVNMLKNGPYPPQTKARILSDRGHLSNGACASLLPTLVKNGTTRLILGHLSQNNNLPTLALSCAKASLIDSGLQENEDYILYIAPPENGRMFYL